LKEFLKHISIYGILPVVGRFAGFFLVPIYARIFSSYEFGIVELIVTLMSFLMFACNLEFYTSIGRFFYDRDSLHERKVMVSTGLFLTIFFTIIIIIVAYLVENSIIYYYLDNGDYHYEYKVSLIWLFFSAIYTYLSIIPRYDKKPKLYIIISVSSLLVRIGSTIVFVLVLKTGIVGVIYGNIAGSIISTILNGIASWKYLGYYFNLKDAKEIFKFSVPIVPGLLLIGLWNPLSRNLVSKYFSIQAVGLLSFAIRITSVMEIINSALGLAWNPLLFENYKKPTFKKDVYYISKFTGLITFWGAVFLTLFAHEIALYVGTPEYTESAILIGFLSFRWSLEVLRRLRGFGPMILKTTYILTINELIGIGMGVAMLVVFSNKLGLAGIGLAFLIPSLVKYIALISYTTRKLKIEFHSKDEIILAVVLIISIISMIFHVSVYIRLLMLVFTTLFTALAVLNDNYKKKFILVKP
jgi:O-antigen/teichoic acid export membrane protein